MSRKCRSDTPHRALPARRTTHNGAHLRPVFLQRRSEGLPCVALCRIACAQEENTMPATTTPSVRLSARISTDLHAMRKGAAPVQDSPRRAPASPPETTLRKATSAACFSSPGSLQLPAIRPTPLHFVVHPFVYAPALFCPSFSGQPTAATLPTAQTARNPQGSTHHCRALGTLHAAAFLHARSMWSWGKSRQAGAASG